MSAAGLAGRYPRRRPNSSNTLTLRRYDSRDTVPPDPARELDRVTLALLPLRAFLGATFVYAGLDKILDPAETRSALLLALQVATRHDECRPFQTGVLQV